MNTPRLAKSTAESRTSSTALTNWLQSFRNDDESVAAAATATTTATAPTATPQSLSLWGSTGSFGSARTAEEVLELLRNTHGVKDIQSTTAQPAQPAQPAPLRLESASTATATTAASVSASTKIKSVTSRAQSTPSLSNYFAPSKPSSGKSSNTNAAKQLSKTSKSISASSLPLASPPLPPQPPPQPLQRVKRQRLQVTLYNPDESSGMQLLADNNVKIESANSETPELHYEIEPQSQPQPQPEQEQEPMLELEMASPGPTPPWMLNWQPNLEETPPTLPLPLPSPLLLQPQPEPKSAPLDLINGYNAQYTIEVTHHHQKDSERANNSRSGKTTAAKPGSRKRKTMHEASVDDTDSANAAVPASTTTPRGLRKKKADEVDVSKLVPLPDVISSDLDVLFLGINPGVESARRGHHFAGRTNYFWHGLHASGLTVQKLPPDHDALLPQAHSSISAYRMGLTNLCPRITKTSAELSGKELADGVPNAVAKIVKYTPKIVCFVGKTAWDVFNNHCGRPSDSVESANGGKGKDKRRAKQPKPASYLGFQTYRRCTIVKANSSKGSSDEDEDEEVNKVTHFFVMPSTSGRTFGFSRDEKLAYFKQLKCAIDLIIGGSTPTKDQVERAYQLAETKSLATSQAMTTPSNKQDSDDDEDSD